MSNILQSTERLLSCVVNSWLAASVVKLVVEATDHQQEVGRQHCKRK